MIGSFPKRTVLVSGGAGFLGSFLCEKLIEQGAKVICVDNLLTGRISNIAHLLPDRRFSFVQHDVIYPIQISEKIDEIYDLACAASPPAYQKDPIHTLQTCILGALNQLDLALRNDARILLASTSEVYGDPDVSPQKESYRGIVNPVGPRACYDEGKRAAETAFWSYHQMHGVKTRIARIFNTYGPRMRADDGRVVSNFIVAALQGQDLTIYGNGSQTRSFCYRDDLVDGLMRLMAVRTDEHMPVNLGNPGEFSVAELARIVIEMTGSTSRTVHCPLPVDDPHQRRPDITAAREKLGWAPTTALHAGLERTIDHFRSEMATWTQENKGMSNEIHQDAAERSILRA